MFHQIRKAHARLLSIMLCLGLVVTAYGVNAETEADTPEKNTASQALLDKKLAYYRHLYPEISFLQLKGGSETVADMMALDLTLGYQPSNMDYEHPPEARDDLVFVSVWRIMRMLQSRTPSSSLFKADTPLGWQQHVCVLTINPDEIAADSLRATRYLLDLPSKILKKIPKQMQLSSADYLEFVVDHEVYHCLQSMYVGPQKMSDKELWAEYNTFIEEKGADAYALGMHIKTQGEGSSFVRNIQRIRGMSLYNADPDHLTYMAMEQVEKIPAENIVAMSGNEILEMANRIKASFCIGYDKYTLYLASAVQAMKEIGVGMSALEELQKNVKGIQADPVQVKELVKNSRRCLAELSGNNVEP